MTTETEKESAMRTASQNGEVLNVRRLLDEKTNPNCTDSVIQIESIDLCFNALLLLSISPSLKKNLF